MAHFSAETNLRNVHVFDKNPILTTSPLTCCAVGLFVIIGVAIAFFLILAAHQVLPQGANAISSLGTWGYVLSWGLMGISLSCPCLLKLKECIAYKKFMADTEPKGSSAYRNEASLSLTSLSNYTEAELFVTEDNYCFVIEEYSNLLKNQFCFYNPYTNVKLSDNDITRLKSNPAIQQCWDELKSQQHKNASKISEATIKALITLAEGFHNRAEITQISHTPVPIAQGYLDQFDCYYNNLEAEEKNALDDFWVPQSHNEETKTTKFRDLYSKMDQSCVHSTGDQIVLMVLLLKPDAEFHVEGFFATSSIDLLRKEHEKNRHCQDSF